MKIIHPSGGVSQFSRSIVTCSYAVMAEVLSAADGSRMKETSRSVLASLKSAANGNSSSFQFVFTSGAKMGLIPKKKNSFYIIGYHYSGLDTLGAVDELLMLYDLRKVNLRLLSMHSRDGRTGTSDIVEYLSKRG